MYVRWDTEWGSRRMPWTGEHPGAAECREFGWYSKFVPDKGWVECSPDDPEATEDLNRLSRKATWDQGRQRWTKRTGETT